MAFTHVTLSRILGWAQHIRASQSCHQRSRVDSSDVRHAPKMPLTCICDDSEIMPQDGACIFDDAVVGGPYQAVQAVPFFVTPWHRFLAAFNGSSCKGEVISSDAEIHSPGFRRLKQWG